MRLLRHFHKTWSRVFHYSTTSAATAQSAPSALPQTPMVEKLFVALSVQRLPILCPPLTEIENKMLKIHMERENRLSYLSKHELLAMRDIKKMSAAAAGGLGKKDSRPTPTSSQASNDETNSLLTAAEKEEMWNTSAAAISLPERETEADLNGRFNTMERKMDRYLHFLIKENINGRDIWLCPKMEWNQGETLRDTANRVVKHYLPSPLSVQLFANAPCHFYRNRYTLPTGERVNARTFFFKAFLPRKLLSLPSTLPVNNNVEREFAFVTKEEIPQFVEHKKLTLVLQQLMLEF